MIAREANNRRRYCSLYIGVVSYTFLPFCQVLRPSQWSNNLALIRQSCTFSRMALKIGIVGITNVCKSTLFNALTRSKGAEAQNYPFCTIEPNVGIVEVPDKRLDTLAAMVKPQKVIPNAIEFVDIAGLVKGASKGEGLGNKFLGAIREVDALCHVVRHFEDDDITHVEGSLDTARDRGIIETELILSDLESLDSRMDKLQSLARGGDKEKIFELATFEKLSLIHI